MNRTRLLFVVCLPLGCALDTEGMGEPSSGGGSGGSGGADVATVGGSGGTASVDASWPGDAAAGTGASQPGDAALDVAVDAAVDAAQEATPEAGVEGNCTNGLDDDGDGLTDCADPDCSSLVRCVPEAPGGWKGPLFVRVREDQEPVTDCGSMLTGDTYHAGLVAGAHTCTCSCGSPTGGSCGDPMATVYPTSNCSGVALASFTGAGCHSLSSHTGTEAPKSVRATTYPAVWPTCAPSAYPNPPEVSWSQAVDTCEVKQSATCEAKEVCVSLPLPGMESMACILRAGDKACPAPFTNKRVYHSDFDDGRECSAAGCSCVLAAGVECGGLVKAEGNKECSFAIGVFDIDGACHAITTPTPVVALKLEPEAMPSASCTSVGTAVSTGSVTPTEPHTVCCWSL